MNSNRKEKSVIKRIFVTIFFIIIGCIVVLSLLKFTPIYSILTGNTTSTVITKNGTKVYEKSSLAESIDKIYKAVVVIQCYEDNSLSSTGSGFVYKTDDKYGYILTNQHVVSDSDKVTVEMNDSDEEIEAKVLGGDEYLDLAVVRIDKSKVEQVADIGSSEDMNLGDSIFTIGAPMGVEYKGSVTSGILSGKDRMVSVSVSSDSISDWVMRVLQIDASINPGNSGGPLVNVNGQVIGIVSMKLVDDTIEGMGFAIPIEYAMNHVEQLENGEEIDWPVLGIGMINVTDTSNLRRYGVSVDSSIEEGVVITQITKDTGAADSDLQEGDVITKIDDNKVTDIAYLRYYLYQHTAGDTVKITYIRNGKENTAEVKLGSSKK